MVQTLLSRAAWFVALWLLQALVFNHIHIFGYGTPLPYLYFLLILPSSTPRWAYVVLGFALGLLTDICANTIGMGAASLTFVGLIVPWLIKLFGPGAPEEGFEPSHRTMEWGGFTKLTIVAVVCHCTSFFCLEYFSFFRPLEVGLHIGGSILLTTLFCVAMEVIRVK